MIPSFADALHQSPPLEEKTWVDHHARIRYSQSTWHGLINFREKRTLDQKIELELTSFFQARYAFKDRASFNEAWRQIGEHLWSPNLPLSVGIIRSIDKAFQSQLIYHGPGINPPIPKQTTDAKDKKAQLLVNFLLHGTKFARELVDVEMLKAVFVRHDKEMLVKLRQALQEELVDLANKPPKNAQEEVLWRAFLGNIIAYLPFSYPPQQEKIMIPVLQEGQCRLVLYNINTVSLKTKENATPMIALDMTPVEDKTAPRILDIIGTTYPSGDGFATTVLADFTPGHSVGEIVYKCNEATFDALLEGASGVHLVGVSLGGAMVLHILRHHADKLSRVDAYNPPGLAEDLWQKPLKACCPVNIYVQPKDIVSNMGSWPVGDHVSLYRVIPHQEDLVKNMFNAHVRAYTGCDYVTILKENPAIKNRSFLRRFLTALHLYLGPLLVYLPAKIVLMLFNFLMACCLYVARLGKNIARISKKYLNRL